MKIGIIGAGILGRLLAIEFSKYNYQITLFEKDDMNSSQSSCATAAGMLNPWSEINESTALVFELGVLSLTHWQEVIQKIAAPEILFHCGSAHVSSYGDKAKLDHLLKNLLNKQENFYCIPLDNNLKKQLFNKTNSSYPYGFYLPDEKCLDPQLFIKKSNDYFKKNNNINFCYDTNILKFSQNTISSENKSEYFDLVLNTTGYHGKSDLNNTLRGVRGSLILVEAPQVNLQSIVRLGHLRYPIYIVPRGQNKYIIGATTHETECMKPMTVEANLELLSTACQFDPGFLEANILEQRVNLRPAFASGEPKIQCKNNVYFINGLYRHGITISPIISHYFCEFIHNNFKLPSHLNYSIWDKLWNN